MLQITVQKKQEAGKAYFYFLMPLSILCTTAEVLMMKRQCSCLRMCASMVSPLQRLAFSLTAFEAGSFGCCVFWGALKCEPNWHCLLLLSLSAAAWILPGPIPSRTLLGKILCWSDATEKCG